MLVAAAPLWSSAFAPLHASWLAGWLAGWMDGWLAGWGLGYLLVSELVYAVRVAAAECTLSIYKILAINDLSCGVSKTICIGVVSFPGLQHTFLAASVVQLAS